MDTFVSVSEQNSSFKHCPWDREEGSKHVGTSDDKDNDEKRKRKERRGEESRGKERKGEDWKSRGGWEEEGRPKSGQWRRTDRPTSNRITHSVCVCAQNSIKSSPSAVDS